MTDAFPLGTVLGYPRIGRRRELVRAVEAHGAGRIDEEELRSRAADLRRADRARLVGLGLDGASAIPESFSFHDQVLDATLAVGALPERFAGRREQDGTIGLAAELAAARGDGEHPPLEMAKWFDTAYHHLVPEVGPETAFVAQPARYVDLVAEAAADGLATRPVVVGPVTLLALAKPADGAPGRYRPLDRLADLLPAYAEILAALRAAGAAWVQLDEPALVSETLAVTSTEVAQAVAQAYAVLGGADDRPSILVAAPYGAPSPEGWAALAASPVEGVALDLVRGGVPAEVDGVADKTIVAGVVDGRNVWRGDLDRAWARLEQVRGLGADRVVVGTSTSLLHVPHDLEDEPHLDDRLRRWLAFADQKVGEVTTLARGLREGRIAVESAFAEAARALADRRSAPGVKDDAVRARTAALVAADVERAPEIDELVRDEPARDDTVLDNTVIDDTVRHCAEKLDGFAVTRNGWVQSWGSRATRPPILWGDVSRAAPLTLERAAEAQSPTGTSAEGVLTGPITTLAWSFVRDDQPFGDTARQVALALRDEIADLEQAGIGIIRVDEPALRELTPLRADEREASLAWSVGALRLATADASPATQIHVRG